MTITIRRTDHAAWSARSETYGDGSHSWILHAARILIRFTIRDNS